MGGAWLCNRMRACVQSIKENCRSWQFTDESFGLMEFNDSPVKCTYFSTICSEYKPHEVTPLVHVTVM